MPGRQRTRLKHEFFLLGLLYHRPRHGYDLLKAIRQSPGLSAIWYVKSGRIYALLDRLEKAGMVTAAQVESHSAPSRKQFTLTPAGEKAYLAWVQQPVGHGRDMRLIFPARLYFALQLGEETALRLIDAQRRECAAWLEGVKSQAQTEEDFFARQIDHYRTGQIEAMLVWLDSCEWEITTHPIHHSTTRRPK
ncbi:MAG: PadR family transcriptional regulator [Anaerolineales bacterium]|nr:PadR family transcriptional regulator [Anaerolineales bacterium]